MPAFFHDVIIQFSTFWNPKTLNKKEEIIKLRIFWQQKEQLTLFIYKNQ